MFRQSPRRNGRNKGLKIKHVLQISLLLGVSVWLLYQVHHSDDRKPPVPNNITEKLKNNSSNEQFKLGRKDLRPKEKEEARVQDNKKEGEEHHHQGNTDEDVNENEGEDNGHDHDSEEGEDIIKAGENDNAAEENEEVKEKEKGDKKGRGKNEKVIKAQGKDKNEATKQGNRSGKSGEKEKGNEKKNEGEEIKGKVNEKKSNEQNKVVVVDKEEKMSSRTKEVEVSSPVEDNGKRVKQEKEEGDKTKTKGPSMDESQSVPNQSNEKVGNVSTQMKQSTSPESYLFEPKAGEENEKIEDSEAQESERVSDGILLNKSGNNTESESVSILEEEKEALTDLGTLPDTGTGGNSINSDNAATE